MHFRPRLFAAALLSTLATIAPTHAKEVHVLVDKDASPLERLAADEVARQLGVLWSGASIDVVHDAPEGDAPLIVVGALGEESTVAVWLGKAAPKLSEQGLLLRGIKHDGRDLLVVAGGSPRATLWAAYELGHRLGVTALLTGDVYPAPTEDIRLTGWDVQLEPRAATRGWVVLDASPAGMWGWGREDRRRLLGQLAKLKFNHVVIEVAPWQPLVRFEHQDVSKAPRRWWAPDPLPVDGDTAGRAAFRGEKEFIAPELAGKSGEALTDAGIALVRAAIDDAIELGMTASIAMPTDDAGPARPSGNVALLPAEFSPLLPNAKFVDAHTIAAENLIRHRSDDPYHETAIALAKAQFEAYRQTYPRADAIDLPKGPPLALTNRVTIEPSGRIGLLPQEPSTAIDELATKLLPLDEYVARPNSLGDCDVLAWRLSRNAWDAEADAKSSEADLFQRLTGDGADERAALSCSFIRKAVETLAVPAEELAQVGPEMVWSHYEAGVAAPASWKPAIDHYVSAMNEMYRAHDRANPRGRPWLRYHCKRLEFALEYLTCLDAVRAAGVARGEKNSDEQIEQLELAVESLYNGLQAYSEVARDQSDRGTIAVLNLYGYQRLKDELDRLTSGE